MITQTMKDLFVGAQVREGFDNSEIKKLSPFGSLIILLIVWVLLLFFGKYLWNDVLVQLIPAIKPVKSIWQILAIHILLNLLKP